MLLSKDGTINTCFADTPEMGYELALYKLRIRIQLGKLYVGGGFK